MGRVKNSISAALLLREPIKPIGSGMTDSSISCGTCCSGGGGGSGSGSDDDGDGDGDGDDNITTEEDTSYGLVSDGDETGIPVAYSLAVESDTIVVAIVASVAKNTFLEDLHPLCESALSRIEGLSEALSLGERVPRLSSSL